jgi:long-chain acyl-CoA synthetase
MVHSTVISQFDHVAASFPRRTAIYWGTDRIRYDALERNISTFAANLQHAGAVGPGGRMGILLRNCPEFLYALYAGLKSGATVVPVNTFLKPPEIQHIINDCGLRHLITDDSFMETTSRLEGIQCLSPAQLAGPPASAPVWPTLAPTDLALIIYTSGTTGKAKGATLTHANIASNVQSCIEALQETQNDRLTLLLPMFHSFMLTVCIFTPLSMGAGIVLIKSVQPFKLAMREIIRNGATILVGIPQLFQAMAQAKVPFWLHWVLKLRLAISGAAPLPRETIDVFERKFRFPLLEGYGLSEASPVVSFNPIRGVRKAGSVGLPLPEIEVQIFDDAGHALGPEQVGEIVVRGPNIMQGYYNQPDETEATLRNGWLHTGDMGKKDDDGYIYIVDRRKEMLLVRGMNVYPREIEEVLYTFPGVREAAVIARPDEKRGEAPVAFVSPADGAELHAPVLMRFCRERLADYKIPRKIHIVEALPRTATGKIAKVELRKMV